MLLLKRKFCKGTKPENGKRIRITWLPSNNGHPNKNCHIGAEGIVESCDEDGFVLRYDSGACLLVLHKKYKFIYI